MSHRIDECRKDYAELIIELSCRAKIMSIFGSESEYNKIPLLELKERKFFAHKSSEYKNRLPFMEFEKEKLFVPQNLEYPIMRGNIGELHFFKIRTKNKLNNTWAIITIYEQYRIDSKRVFGWRAHSNYGITNEGESLSWWINNPNENNWVVYSCFTTPFAELRKTIQNGENSVEVIE